MGGGGGLNVRCVSRDKKHWIIVRNIHERNLNDYGEMVSVRSWLNTKTPELEKYGIHSIDFFWLIQPAWIYTFPPEDLLEAVQYLYGYDREQAITHLAQTIKEEERVVGLWVNHEIILPEFQKSKILDMLEEKAKNNHSQV